MFRADPLEMNTTRPQFFARIAGRKCRDRRIPLITLTSKKRCQSVSVISSNGLGSKMPTLLTRISAVPARRKNSATPSGVARSAATPSAFAPATAWVSCLTASLTALSWRPLITTAAPASARPFAIAKPSSAGGAADPRTTAAQVDLHARFSDAGFIQATGRYRSRRRLGGSEQIAQIEALGDHVEIAGRRARPLLLGAVPVELDAVLVRVAQIERFAHPMIARPVELNIRRDQ